MLLSGEDTWWEEVQKDDDKLYKVMKAYKDHRKLVLAGQKSAKSFRLVEVKQSMIRESGLDIIGKGMLMNKRFFVQWATAIFSHIHLVGKR